MTSSAKQPAPTPDPYGDPSGEPSDDLPNEPSKDGAPERIRAATAADLLAYIPHQVGFMPYGSLVGITSQDSSIRATVRVDLPVGNPPGGSWLDDYADAFVSMILCDTEAEGVLLVIYGQEDWVDPGETPYVDLLTAISGRLRLTPLEITEAWYIGREHWRTLMCFNADCCPWPGHPISEITDSVLGAELVFRGSSYVVDVAQAVRELVSPAPEERVASFAASADRVADALGEACMFLPQFRAILQAWEWALSSSKPLSPALADFLAASLDSITVRDAVLVQASVGYALAFAGTDAEGLLQTARLRPVRPSDWPSNAVELAAVQRASKEVLRGPVSDFGRVLIGHSDRAPQWGRVERAVEILVQLARVMHGQRRAAALTMLGWWEWAMGHGRRAGTYYELALEEVPEYRLADLLAELLGRGVVCGWAENPQLAWRGRGAA
ncbi:MAG: DUF4192 family protein [Acidobacteria bacterium]|nr:DUF4192 family protein [Acidobacteriota bacterium]